MGMFRGAKWATDDGKEYSYMIAWGSLVKDTDVQMYNKKKTSFTIKTHRGVFQNCVIWGESVAANIAAALEKGDEVLVLGVWGESEFTNKKGETKKYNDLRVDIILPMSLLQFLTQLYGSKGVAEAIQNAQPEADALESAEDEFMQVPDDMDELPFR